MKYVCWFCGLVDENLMPDPSGFAGSYVGAKHACNYLGDHFFLPVTEKLKQRLGMLTRKLEEAGL